jgi:hypothetical protein
MVKCVSANVEKKCSRRGESPIRPAEYFGKPLAGTVVRVSVPFRAERKLKAQLGEEPQKVINDADFFCSGPV